MWHGGQASAMTRALRCYLSGWALLQSLQRRGTEIITEGMAGIGHAYRMFLDLLSVWRIKSYYSKALLLKPQHTHLPPQPLNLLNNKILSSMVPIMSIPEPMLMTLSTNRMKLPGAVSRRNPLLRMTGPRNRHLDVVMFFALAGVVRGHG